MAVRPAPGRRLTISLVVIAVLAVGIVSAAHALSRGTNARYRTATVTSADVTQDLVGVGSVTRVNQFAASFPVSGTVASVAVQIGTKVMAGQVLATLSTTSLDQSVNQAVATLAGAQQTLATDQASETAAVATATALAGATTSATNQALVSGPSTSAPIRLTALVQARPSGLSSAGGSRPGSAGGTGGSVSQLISKIKSAQQALLAAQQKLDADLAAAESALSTCQSALSQPSSTPTPTATPTTTATATARATATASAPPINGTSSCLDAIGNAPSKADAAADERARDQAEQALNTDITAIEQTAQASGGKSGGSGSGSGSTGGGSTGRTGGGTGASSHPSTGRSSGSSPAGGTSSRSTSGTGSALSGTGRTSASSGPATAQQLAADQAQVDAAQAQLSVAQQNLSAATLRSPLTGTVGAVGLTAGKTANTSASITVIGDGQSEVSTTVSLNDIDRVKIGDPAAVKVDGIGQTLTGKVTLIGILNVTTGSSTSYPVTILLDPTSQKLYDGAGASVQIQVAQVSQVLTVPTSAVHSVGQFSFVSVLSGGAVRTIRISVGAVGTERTQVTSGLKAGQQVVLANLSEPLPTTAG